MRKLLVIALLFIAAAPGQSQEPKMDKEKWAEIVEKVNYEERSTPEKRDESPERVERQHEYEGPDLLPSNNTSSVQVLAVIGVVILLVVIIILLIDSSVFTSLTGKQALRVNIEDPDYLDEAELNKALDQTSKEADFKSSIRIYYLMLLERLDKNRLIRWRKSKTNRQYIVEIRKKAIRKDLKRLTRVYEDVWFGEVSLSRDQFSYWSNEFEELMQKGIS